MKPTELIYSSHDRCEYLHREWIVQRALESPTNKTIFYLPFSSGSDGDQQYSWGTFSRYLDRFRPFGLEPRTMIFSDDLSRGEQERFFQWLAGSEVVILGGGSTVVGLKRYALMGERLHGDPERVIRVLRERRARGLLTVGFSSGADQLSEWSCDLDDPVRCYGIVRQVIARLHFEHGGEDKVAQLVQSHPDCLGFGLPNDSGIAVNEGTTPAGTFWQYLQFITDNSWDRPEDQWHIKTRQGVKIEHRYPDGRDWKLNGGDAMLRVIYADGKQEAWIKLPHVPRFVHYWTVELTPFETVDEILAGR
jgi:hypothetical protein